MSETGLPGEFVNPPSKIVQRGQSRLAGPKCRVPFLLHRFLWASKENDERSSVFSVVIVFCEML